MAWPAWKERLVRAPARGLHGDCSRCPFSRSDATAIGEPRGLAADAKGFIWWADTASNASRLMRLEPAGSDSAIASDTMANRR